MFHRQCFRIIYFTYAFVLSPPSKKYRSCRYPVAGIPTPTAARQDSRSHPELHPKGRSSRAPRVRLLPHRANGPGPAPRSRTGPVTPRVPEEGKPRANSRDLGPPMGVPDLPRPSGPPTRVEPTYRRGVRSRHVSHRQGRGRKPSAGSSVTHPHSMRVVEACSTTAARGAAFVRPHCRPHITEVHSAAACAASAEPVCRINWI